jgi:hypothetical protein
MGERMFKQITVNGASKLMAAALLGAAVSFPMGSSAGRGAESQQPPADEGRKVIISNTSEKPVLIKPTETVKVEVSNHPAELKVVPIKYTYRFFAAGELEREIRGNPMMPGQPPLTGQDFAAFLTREGYEFADSPLASQVVWLQGGVLLRKAK